MAKTINNIKELQDYFKGVVERADHHAQGVKEIIYPTLCLIIAYFDPNSDINVMARNGNTANMMWVHINGTRYAFAYEHTNSVIEIRKDNAKGQVLHTIDNTLTINNLINIFESL